MRQETKFRTKTPASDPTPGSGGQLMALSLAMLLAACGERPVATPTTPAATTAIAVGAAPALPVSGEAREFTGTMSLTGTRQQLATYRDTHQAAAPVAPAIFRVGGTLLLSGPARPNLGFHAEFIGFSAGERGLQGHGVWTDERGDRAFSDLFGRELGPGRTVNGRFVGGTGRYEGISGTYTFSWQSLTDAEEGQVAVRVSDLRGRVILRPANAPEGVTK